MRHVAATRGKIFSLESSSEKKGTRMPTRLAADHSLTWKRKGDDVQSPGGGGLSSDPVSSSGLSGPQ